jgi:hypothetical protein
MALRRDQRLGSVPAGTAGTVVSVDAEAASVTIRWPERTLDLPAAILARCPAAYGYATTPGYLAGRPARAVLALGDPGPKVREATIYAVAPSRRDLLEQQGPEHRRADALAAAAEIRPTETVLAHLGPPPTDGAEREAWRAAARAIESYRDRWDLPDRPHHLDLDAREPGLDLSRRSDQLRVLAACRAVERTNAPELAPAGR